MPTKRRCRTRNLLPQIEDWQIQYLETGQAPEGHRLAALLLEGDRGELRRLWEACREDILARWVVAAPGTRPWGWWWHDAPRWRAEDMPAQARVLNPKAFSFPEPRRRLGGTGTPQYECLAVVPRLEAAIPVDWVSSFDADFYRGKAKDIHGNPIGTEFVGHRFDGKAIDFGNLPRYEAEASYLKRHNLLLPGEAERLTDADFAAETVYP